jgi:chromosome partitioning protein
MPGNIELSAIEVSLVNTMSRETILRTYIHTVKDKYDYVLIDCMPSLGMMTINALAAADSVIIPVQAHYLPAKGMTQLLQTIARVRRQINPRLTIDGVLLTMVDNRTNFAKDISFILRRDYGDKLRIFQTEIALSIRAAETSAQGKSIYLHDPHGLVAKAMKPLRRRCGTLTKSSARDSIKLASVDDLFHHRGKPRRAAAGKGDGHPPVGNQRFSQPSF